MNFIQKLINKIFKKGEKVDQASVTYIDVNADVEPEIAFVPQDDNKTESAEQEQQTVVAVEPVEGVIEDAETATKCKVQLSFNKIVRSKYKGKQKRLAKRGEQLTAQKAEAADALAKYDADAYLTRLITADQNSVETELLRVAMMQAVTEEEFNKYMQLKSEKHAYGELIKMLTARKKAINAQMAACPKAVKEFAKGVSPVLPSDLAETAKAIEDKVSVETTDEEIVID